jgi:hypothetical protein
MSEIGQQLAPRVGDARRQDLGISRLDQLVVRAGGNQRRRIDAGCSNSRRI